MIGGMDLTALVHQQPRQLVMASRRGTVQRRLSVGALVDQSTHPLRHRLNSSTHPATLPISYPCPGSLRQGVSRGNA